ncbi:MAG: membrane protein insertion efficiency factor YidD [Bacteroidales bacterium]
MLKRYYTKFNKVLSLLFIFIVRIYKALISPILPSACRYTPTCSEYAMKALKQYGFFLGILLTLKRVFSCNPFGGYGYDPVPQNFRKFHKK